MTAISRTGRRRHFIASLRDLLFDERTLNRRRKGRKCTEIIVCDLIWRVQYWRGGRSLMVGWGVEFRGYYGDYLMVGGGV